MWSVLAKKEKQLRDFYLNHCIVIAGEIHSIIWQHGLKMLGNILVLTWSSCWLETRGKDWTCIGGQSKWPSGSEFVWKINLTINWQLVVKNCNFGENIALLFWTFFSHSPQEYKETLAVTLYSFLFVKRTLNTTDPFMYPTAWS